MEKTEITGVKAVGVNIEHIEVGPIDLGLKGKHNFLSFFILGVIFYVLSVLPLGLISTFALLFSVVCFMLGIVQVVRIVNPNFAKEKNF